MRGRIHIKVCGMRHTGNIADIATLQPDYLGFIFYDQSPRYVGPGFVLPIDIPLNVRKVGVFVNQTTTEILEIFERYRLDYVQLHGTESPEQLSVLKKKRLGIIKAFGVDDDFDFAVTNQYQGLADYFLFDSRGRYFGGNGQPFDWTKLAAYGHEVPYFLSGGINASNCQGIESLVKTKLHAIDINSGAEISPGTKEKEKVAAIMKTINTFV